MNSFFKFIDIDIMLPVQWLRCKRQTCTIRVNEGCIQCNIVIVSPQPICSCAQPQLLLVKLMLNSRNQLLQTYWFGQINLFAFLLR